jgi:D-aminoacyl-tRNA deacylase
VGFMRAVVQRVMRASVAVRDQITGEIGKGLMVLLGVEVGDGEKDAEYIADKVLTLRVFEDAEEKMNLALADVGGGILVVSQFTLLGDARDGRRPSFIRAERPQEADALYRTVVNRWREKSVLVETGVFGESMAVSLVNDGPVTILLDSRKLF